MTDEKPNEFETAAGEERGGLIAEFFAFLADNKKWWLAPILLTILTLGVLFAIGGLGGAPFIYTLF
ncbi:MAG: DUF5989 family protein [Planctomycetota bacterium]